MMSLIPKSVGDWSLCVIVCAQTAKCVVVVTSCWITKRGIWPERQEVQQRNETHPGSDI